MPARSVIVGLTILLACGSAVGQTMSQEEQKQRFKALIEEGRKKDAARAEADKKKLPEFKKAANDCIEENTVAFTPGGMSPDVAANLAFDACERLLFRVASAQFPELGYERNLAVVEAWRKQYIPAIAKKIIARRSASPAN